MNAKKQTSYSGAVLRMQAEQFAAQADPKVEAERHERYFLAAMGAAKEHFDWIIANSAWATLGHGTFASWWEDRVMPIANGLGMRPTRDMAKAVIEKVREEEATLPKAQRRTQQQIAAMVGLDRSSLSARDGSRSVPRDGSRQSDLDDESAAAARGTAADEERTDADVLDGVGSSAGHVDGEDVDVAGNPTEDHRDLTPGETDDAAAQPSSGPSAPSGVFGADGTTEPEEPHSLAATGDVEGQAPERVPASAPPIPSWLRAVTAVNAAIFDLRQEDPYTVGLLIPADLAGELGASIKDLTAFYKDMHEDVLGQRAT